MIKDINAITPEYMEYRIEQETEQYKQEIERLNNRLKTSNDTCNYLRNTIDKAIELTNKIIEAGWDYDEKDSLAIKLEEILKDSDKE